MWDYGFGSFFYAFHTTQNFFGNRCIKEALKYSFKVSDALQTDFMGIRIVKIGSHFVVLPI
jgi:hypothetical protein